MGQVMLGRKTSRAGDRQKVLGNPLRVTRTAGHFTPAGKASAPAGPPPALHYCLLIR